MRFLFILLLGCCAAQAQTMQIRGAQGEAGFSKLNMPFPEKMQVMDADKKVFDLKIEGPTLIQVWSTCCGMEPDTWAEIREIEKAFKGQGLTTISINFENGMEAMDQPDTVMQALGGLEIPENLVFDFLGYVVDDLNVPGFPTYFLVNKNGRVIFRTNGKLAEGVAILQLEIENMLAAP